MEEERNFAELEKEKLEKAQEKFGVVIYDFATREKLKRFATETGVEDFRILSHWSRSIIGSNFDLNHPNYLEYKKHYQKGDVEWLPQGASYVDIKKYKKWKENN